MIEGEFGKFGDIEVFVLNKETGNKGWINLSEYLSEFLDMVIEPLIDMKVKHEKN